ncbi:MAG TPA: STAS domain-containing protein [Streptosporangiaceae bacterium]|nr:STAS domain-containing protein [Streptosporangiaceae bacterium]
MSAPAGFPVATISGLPVVRGPAEVDITNAGQLRAALLAAAGEGHATIVVDLSGTAFCDTAGLQVLVLAHRRARAEGGELRLVVRAATLLQLLRLTGVDQVIPSFTSLDEALSELPAIAIRPPLSGTAWVPRILAAS